MVEWEITNVVFVLKFNIDLPIDRLASALEKDGISISYEPENFPALIVTLEDNKEENKIKATIFKSGAMNIYGLKKLDEIYNIINEIKNIFGKYSINLPDNYEMKLTNIVIAGKFDNTNIDIEKMYNDFDDAGYDPGRFPGVSIPYYLSKNYKITFNIFRDGHFVCAGIKGDISAINQHINEIVNSFQENVIKKYVRT